MFTVYSLPNCKYCEMTKALLKTAGQEFREEVIGIDILREEFIDRYPYQKTAPLIFDNEINVGGYDDLIEYLEKKGRGPQLIEG